MDIERAFKSVMKEGKVVIGIRQTKKAIENGEAEAVVFAKNCPFKSDLIKILKEKNIKYMEFDGNGIELGYTCGKPFSISTFAVIDAGTSSILKLFREG
ncbi:MAG TPA: 50S ribosomal protein L30e [Thermoplasmatales archaeon]|nr:50S ribosomal protein L30e [Thermoplasmatales archaeon]HEX17079.1 50S ribosomal protein L30e [Thermoplasmatales archaeon]